MVKGYVGYGEEFWIYHKGYRTIETFKVDLNYIYFLFDSDNIVEKSVEGVQMQRKH